MGFNFHRAAPPEVTGAIAHEYDAANATMREYFHVAAILEQQRVRAEERGEVAPRVLLLSDLSKLLRPSAAGRRSLGPSQRSNFERSVLGCINRVLLPRPESAHENEHRGK